jgi:hypothetical protein
MTHVKVGLMALAAVLAVNVDPAAAQDGTYRGFATAFAGWHGSGDLPRATIPFGGAVSVNEDSGWGADMELVFSDDDSGSTAVDVLTFMLNANWTKPQGTWRPYIGGGLGALRLHGCLIGCPNVSSTTDLGANVGGGIYVRASDIVFVRGEVKYLWAPGKHPDLSRPDNYGFVRASIGITVMWTMAP